MENGIPAEASSGCNHSPVALIPATQLRPLHLGMGDGIIALLL